MLNKLNISNTYFIDKYEDEIEVVIISGDNVDNISQFVDNLGGKYLDLGYNFGIVTISVDKIVDLALNPKINYIEFPKNLYITDEQGNRASCVPQAISTYNIYGEGVLIGFIDTGIDYTHPAFLNDDGTTRIEYIYDLEQEGKIYDKTMINEALKSSNPFSIVSSIDAAGHGTHVAGIACAGGKIDKRYYGVAPKSSIAMVKVARSLFGLSTQIMKGIKFLVDKSKELNMPLVINMSLSTNDGAHNGTSLFEQYISTTATLERLTIVIASGNEGEAAHHIGGEIKDIQEIYFNVASDESIISINLYKSLLPRVSIELVSPSGVSTGEIFIAQGFRSGSIRNSKYDIYYTGPAPFDISGQIGIILTGVNGYVSSGQWKIVLRRVNEYSGTFDMWLPISEGLNISTEFLNPTTYNTLGIPATVNNIISVGSYNSSTNTISAFSGRGKMYEGQYIKPDVVAPGVNIISAIPNRSFDRKTGTSMATPNVSGICALMMQWGVIKGNDPYLYGERLKYYLSLGAKKGRRDIVYPDSSWGYGEVCIDNSLELLTETLGNRQRKERMQENNLSSTVINNDGDNNERSFYIFEVGSEEVVDKILSIPGVDGIRISEVFALILTSREKLTEVEKYANRMVDYDIQSIYTLSAISPIDASGATEIRDNPYLRLNGRGTIIGIIDTGIDYLNEEFQREDDTSRVIRLWDQSLYGDIPILGLKYGREFTDSDINEAIQAQKRGENPYSIVPSRDEVGHGTTVAGIAGARGINPDLKGVAPDCEFIVVKLANATKVDLDEAYIDSKEQTFNLWNIFLALRYIVNTANKLNKPAVIYIPLESNMGSHVGNSPVEQLINNVSAQVGTLCVTNSGNQGNTATHTEGVIASNNDSKDIELRVGSRQNILPIQIWINQPNIVSLSIISPSGEIINDITSKNSPNRNVRFTYEGTEMNIIFASPEFTTGDTLIYIRAKNLREGIWRFRLTGKYIVNGNYYAWIPQRQLLDSDTKFLDPIDNSTITLPSTSPSSISVAYYDQNSNSIVSESGRGYTRIGIIKPDVAAGGINAVAPNVGGGTKIVSGASVAGAVVAGSCALILQWAIVNGNNNNLYAVQVRAYIRAGARTRPGDIYPNRNWGYGMFDLEGVFNTIREIYSEAENRSIKNDYEEYNVKGLFVRKPKKM
ncbi:MAG: S8 family serine peptidase [Clostridium sp.]|nr:S8 family serine peptidase [Clostridium sp.]